MPNQTLHEDADVKVAMPAASMPSLTDASLGSTANLTTGSVLQENWLLAFSAVDEKDRGRVTRDDLMRAIASGALTQCFPLGCDEELSRVDDLFAAVFGESASVTATEWSCAWSRLPESVRRNMGVLLADKQGMRWS